jgi:hypothetical protein
MPANTKSATGLGPHVNVRSSRFSPAAQISIFARSVKSTAYVEFLDYYPPNERPDTLLHCTVHHSSDFRRDVILSDLPGHFPVRAKDGSEYLLLSVYKNYIHVETLPDLSGPRLCAAYSATHTFFRKLGHHVKVQVLDNETSVSLFSYFNFQNISYQLVHLNKNEPTPLNELSKRFVAIS